MTAPSYHQTRNAGVCMCVSVHDIVIIRVQSNKLWIHVKLEQTMVSLGIQKPSQYSLIIICVQSIVLMADYIPCTDIMSKLEVHANVEQKNGFSQDLRSHWFSSAGFNPPLCISENILYTTLVSSPSHFQVFNVACSKNGEPGMQHLVCNVRDRRVIELSAGR